MQKLGGHVHICDAWQAGVEGVPEIIAMILLPVGVLMCGYALMVFLWRSSQIARKQASF